MKNPLFALGLLVVAVFLTAAAPPVFRPDAGVMFSQPATPANMYESMAAVQMPGTAVAPSGVSDGFNLGSLSAKFDVYVEISLNPDGPADDAGTYDPSGAADAHAMKAYAVNTLPDFTILAYLQHPVTKKWAHYKDLDFAVTGNTTSFVKTISKPTELGRIAFVVPAGLSCPTNVRLVSKK